MTEDAKIKSLEKWDVLRGVERERMGEIALFHAFQTYAGDVENRMASALFVTSKDEVFAVGYNGGDNLLALEGAEFAEVAALKKPKKIDKLSGQNIRKIAVSERFGCALTEDGRFMYWGIDMKSLQYELSGKKYVKEPHEPRTDLRIKDMSCGAHSVTLVTNENQVFMWGCINLYYSRFYDFEKVPLRKKLEVRGVAAGWYHVALLDQNGHVWTFGYGSVGQLGYPWVGLDEIIPKKVPLPGPCRKVECGAYSTLFLLSNGELYACGSNSQSDHLCVGKTGRIISPTKVLLDDKIADIAATYAWSSENWQSLFSAAANDPVKYFKWGDDPKTNNPKTVGEISNLLDIFANFKTPQSLGNFVQDSATVSYKNKPSSTQSSQVINESILKQWLVLDILDNDFIRKVKSFTVFKGFGIAVNRLGAFIVTTDDEVYAWGYNGGLSGSLGLGLNDKEISKPTKVENLSGKRIKKILVNSIIGGLAVSEDGVLFVWEDNSLPQEEENVRGKSVVDVADGQSFYIYLLANSEVYCVFLNGTRINKFQETMHVKVGIPQNENAVAVSAGTRHFVVLTDQSNVYAYAFRNSHYGNLGPEWESFDRDGEETNISRLKINQEPCKKIMTANDASYFLTKKGELYRLAFTYYVDLPGYIQKRVVYTPEKLKVDEEVEDIAGTYYDLALKTNSGKIFHLGGRDTQPEEDVRGATNLVEAFAEETIPGSLSLVRLSHTSPNPDTNRIYSAAPSRKNNFFSDPLYSDVTIKLKDGVVPAHKVFLHTKSAFFENILSSNKIINQDELDLVSYNPKAVRALLKFIYDLPIGRRTSSLKDALDFRKISLKDGNSDLIKIAEEILLQNSLFDKQLEHFEAVPSRNETHREKTKEFMESSVFP